MSTSHRSILRITVADSVIDVHGRVGRAGATDVIVAVDDAHRLSDDVLRVITITARQGVPMVITRRPTLDRAALAALEEAIVSADGVVEALKPLTAAEMSRLIRTLRGSAPESSEVERITVESGGLPGIAAAIIAADGRDAGASAALRARIQQRLALAGGKATQVCRVFALDADLDDDVICRAAGTDHGELAATLRELRDAGLIGADGQQLVPAVAAAVKAELSAVELRRVHDDVAKALIESGSPPLLAATQLRAARVRSQMAAQVYTKAGDELRFTDPETALAWYDDAVEAGTVPDAVSAGQAEAAALLGRPIEVNYHADSRLALVEGAVETHQGRAARAVDTLVSAGPIGQILAVPMLMSLGRRDEAVDITRETGNVAVWLRRFAEATVAVVDPSQSIPLFIEAAEVMERSTPAVVSPDTPHAVGAIVATAASDVATAERLLTSAITSGAGGPVAAERHRLLLAWVRMRTGRFDTAQAELRRSEGQYLIGRERLLRASLAAGIARRSGDVAAMRTAWELAEPALVRGGTDLFQLELAEELVVAAARLRKPGRAQPVFAALETITDRLGRPRSWVGALEWMRVQFAVAMEDVTTVRQVAERWRSDAGAADRVAACAAAAAAWSEVLDGTVDSEAVLAAADLLDAAELPWEASRLTGQAAIRTSDPDDARHLLERARAFTHRPAEPTNADHDQRAGLSDREVEVARLVLAGRTHKEIGGQLYLSPKTVEHHVARIRTKLGVRTREEFIAALREIL